MSHSVQTGREQDSLPQLPKIKVREMSRSTYVAHQAFKLKSPQGYTGQDEWAGLGLSQRVRMGGQWSWRHDGGSEHAG